MATYGLSVFNPSASGKTLLLFSLKAVYAGANNTHLVTLTANDPALGNSGLVTNNKAGSGTSSVASTTYATANQGIAGSTHDYVQTAQNGTLEVFTNGDVELLPPGYGLAFWMSVTSGRRQPGRDGFMDRVLGTHSRRTVRVPLNEKGVRHVRFA